ncbi:MAG: MEMAR_RS02690 family S-layer glycoprotein, partial [Methanoregula sp.]|nr:MEMAR_RS02690 family S-layer glycoprotein [Methanoregula sp.]
LSIALVAVALLLVLVAVMPVSAYTVRQNITQGATIYIGESGLNLTSAIKNGVYSDPTGGTSNSTPGDIISPSIGWWASAAVIRTTSPTLSTVVIGQNDYTVSPSVFGQGIGNWYLINKSTGYADTPAMFVVADPTLALDIWDFGSPTANVGLPATGKSIVQGEWLGFKIDTNQYNALSNAAMNSGGRWSLLNFADPNNPQWTQNNTATYDGYIDITVKDASGTTLTGLLNASTSSGGYYNTLLQQNVSYQSPNWIWGHAPSTYNPQGAITGATVQFANWSTGATDLNGQFAYPAGSYTAYATSKLNGMNDNYKLGGADYTGKTVSAVATVTLVSDSVKIEANKDTVVRSKSFSVTVTGKPSTSYHIWVKGTSSMDATYDNQPPMIRPSQLGVKQDPYEAAAFTGNGFNTYAPGLAGNYTYQNGGGGLTNNIWSNVAHGNVPSATDTSRARVGNGTYLYANISLSSSGTRTVEWLTTNWTKAQTYTIRVEQQFVNSVANTGDNVAGFVYGAGNYKSDEVNVKVEKGTVTIVAAGSQSYYLGEEIKFSGTNTETQTTYLFITGPNLKSGGSSIKSTNPRAVAVDNNDAAQFQTASVLGDNTWSWKWGTATVALDAGTYTIYAVASPNNAKDQNLENTAFGTVSIIIKKPFVSATASQSTVAQGDKILITGTAEGQPTLGVMIWVLGKNYPTAITDVKTQSVNADGSFKYEISGTSTKNLYPGQYFVVVQHPMQNNVFDVKAVTEGANVVVKNMQLNVAGQTAGTNVFTLLGASSLQGSDAAEALVQGINSPNVDDTYTKLQFLVEVPVITIAPVGDKHVGDKFTISATTNLAVDDEVLVQVYSSSFKPTQKSQSGEFSGATGTVKVKKGTSGMNTITFDVDSSTFKPDEYIVTESAILQVATGTALFNVLEGAAPVVTTKAPVVVTTVAPVVTTVAPVVTTAVPTTTPKPAPGYGALIALIGLGAVAFIVVRRH